MERILFLGNGLNLIPDDGASWNALLNQLDGEVHSKHEEALRKAKPFTLWFEKLKIEKFV